MPSIKDFIEDNSAALSASLRQKMKPLHDYTDSVHPGIASLLRPARGLQGHIVTASIKALETRRSVIFGMGMGTGKTFTAIATAHLLAGGKPYSTLIVSPPHLVPKWQREIEATVPDAVVITVNNWEEWLMLAKSRKVELKFPTYFLTPLSVAKLGARWVPAVFTKQRLGEPSRPLLCCPRCFTPLHYRRLGADRPMTMQHLKADKRCCHQCNEPCWQNVKPHKAAPSRIIKKHLKKWFDVVIMDEQHMCKSGDTQAGDAFSHFVAAGKKIMVLTGTLIAGRAIDLMPTLYRIFPQRFVSRGIKWDDHTKFNEMYGRIETLRQHNETHKQGRVFSGRHKSRKKVMPGIMPSFYRDFLADCTIFCSLKEMMAGEAELPKLEETMVDVPMTMAMSVEYACMKKSLIGAFLKVRQEEPETAMRFISTVAETLATWPDDPHGWEPIGYKDKDGIWHEVYRPKDMEDEVTPKEQKLLSMITQEKSEGRQVWVFCTRHATADRLLKLMVRNFISCAHLTADVPPFKREDWIRDYGPGMDCVLSHPGLIETGIDLFGYGPGKYGVRYNFCTLVHF